MKVMLGVLPPVGSDVIVDGFRYVFVGTKPHQRKDGTPSMLWLWQADCASCGNPFVTTAPERFVGENKRCSDHRAPGKPA